MRTHCYKCKNQLEPDRVGKRTLCILCYRAYDKLRRIKEKENRKVEYIENEYGQKIKLLRPLKASDYYRFWSKATLTADIEKCWNWTSMHVMGTNMQYGKFDINRERFSAHRVAYFIQNKVDPKELCVLHKCDNPKCVNPNHLFLGTTEDNVKDRDKKGRNVWNHLTFIKDKAPKGSKHWRAKLNESDIPNIKEKYSNGNTSLNELAAEYKVSKKAILNIIQNKSWTHV